MSEKANHRFQRLLLLAQEIQARPGQKAEELAKKMGVSKRNLFRDIKLLQESGYSISNQSEGYTSQSQPLEHGLSPWSLPGAGEVEITIRLDKQLAAKLTQSPLHPSQQIRNQKMTLKVSGADRVVDWLLSVEGAELLEPTWLRGSLLRRAEALTQLYK